MPAKYGSASSVYAIIITGEAIAPACFELCPCKVPLGWARILLLSSEQERTKNTIAALENRASNAGVPCTVFRLPGTPNGRMRNRKGEMLAQDSHCDAKTAKVNENGCSAAVFISPPKRKSHAAGGHAKPYNRERTYLPQEKPRHSSITFDLARNTTPPRWQW